MEEKEFSLRNYEHYKSYYSDTSKEDILQDTYIDYLAYTNLTDKYDKATSKLNEIKKYCTAEREDINGSKCDDILSIIDKD